MGIVGIIGTVHDDNLSVPDEFTLEDMKTIIKEFSPDIICGEVRPEDWDRYFEDKSYSGFLGHDEYRKMVIPFCEENDVQFIPVDWFEWDIIKLNYESILSKEQLADFKNKLFDYDERIRSLALKSKIPFNSTEINNVIRSKKNYMGSINPKVHNIYWLCRNQIVVERIKNVISENPDKKILCITSLEHCYFYYDELKGMGIEVKFPLK